LLRVGPGRAHATIQGAIDAAVSGDLILVDPGTYAGFVLTKALAIGSSQGSSAPIKLVGRTGVATIEVSALLAGASATLHDMRLAHFDPTAPSIWIHDCGGFVRLSGVEVDLAADVVSATTLAVVEVERTACFWADNFVVASAIARRGSSVVACQSCGPNRGLSALLLRDAWAILRSVKLRGFDNPTLYSGMSYGGDALRIVGNSHAFLQRDSGPTNQLQGGNGSVYGGSAIHILGSNPVVDTWICGLTFLQPGTGPQGSGGALAVNNDRGIVQPGIERAPPACVVESYGAVEFGSPWLTLNSVSSIRVQAVVGARLYAVFLDARAVLARVPGVDGIGVLDFSTQQGPVFLTGGFLPSTGSTVVPISVPGDQALQGLQLTAQGALGPARAQLPPTPALTHGAFATVVK